MPVAGSYPNQWRNATLVLWSLERRSSTGAYGSKKGMIYL